MPMRSASSRASRHRTSRPRCIGSRKSYANVLQRETAMITEHEHPDLRRLWQSQADESTSMSIDDLRSRVSHMNRNLLFRGFIAGLAFLLFIGFFGATLTWRVSTLVTPTDIEITRGIFLIGAGYGMWQLIA